MNQASANVVNLPRGAKTITIDGTEHRAIPTPNAIWEIEAKLGTNINPLIMQLGAGDFGLTVITEIYAACIKAGDTPEAHRPTRDQIAHQVMADGIQNHRDTCLELASAVFGREFDKAVARDQAGKSAGPAAST